MVADADFGDVIFIERVDYFKPGFGIGAVYLYYFLRFKFTLLIIFIV